MVQILRTLSRRALKLINFHFTPFAVIKTFSEGMYQIWQHVYYNMHITDTPIYCALVSTQKRCRNTFILGRIYLKEFALIAFHKVCSLFSKTYFKVISFACKPEMYWLNQYLYLPQTWRSEGFMKLFGDNGPL